MSLAFVRFSGRGPYGIELRWVSTERLRQVKTLFLGGKLFDGEQAPVDGLGVLVDDGKITRVAPAGEFDGYSGQRIDTSGGTLMPGLIDCHVHLCLGGEADPKAMREAVPAAQLVMSAFKRAQDNLAGGITAVRDCGGKDYLEFAVRDACNSGAQLGPTIRAAGRMICMTGGHGNSIGRVADGPEEVTKAVREQIHAGSDLIKVMASGGVMTPGVNPEDSHYTFEELEAGISEAHRFDKHTASHAQGTESILNATRAGVDSIEHGIFMTEECVEEMIARGTYLVPTLMPARGIRENSDFLSGLQPYVREKFDRVDGRTEKSLKMFYDAGGKVAMGTDVGVPFAYHGQNAQELAYMVETGMSPLDALIAGTANGADLMRLENEGRIKEGFAADLLVVDGDPNQDIAMAAYKTNHRFVFKRGVPVTRADDIADNGIPFGMAAL